MLREELRRHDGATTRSRTRTETHYKQRQLRERINAALSKARQTHAAVKDAIALAEQYPELKIP